MKNIFSEEEVVKDATVAKNATVRRKEGGREVERQIDCYSLDIIIAIGYRARSTKRATEFRKWATKILKEHITQGYTINENILKKKQDLYLKALEDIKLLSKNNKNLKQVMF
ncbi:MAG: RhuM family protein [Parcubacteria group bacterium]